MTIKDKSLRPFFIDIDDNNFIVKEVSISNGEKTMGQEVESIVGYYSNLDTCIQRIIRLKSTREEVTLSLQLFLEEYRKTSNQVTDTINEKAGT